MTTRISVWSILLCVLSLFISQQIPAQTIDFEGVVDSGPAFGSWAFDFDDTPCDPGPDDGNESYAYVEIVWHVPAQGDGSCIVDPQGSGVQSSGICTAEDTAVLDGTDGVTIEFGNLSLSSFEHRNWCNVGQLGDHRVYTGGSGSIKVNGVTKLKIVNARISLDVDYPIPLGVGGLVGAVRGSGWGTIDMDLSDADWIAEFDPDGAGQVEFTFGSFSPVNQDCWGAYEFELQIGSAPPRMGGDEIIVVPVVENLVVVNVVAPGVLSLMSGDVDARAELNVKEFENGGLNEDMNAFMAIQVLDDPGGIPPVGIEIISPYCFWELGTALDSITADVTFDLSEMPGIQTPDNLRILRREDADAPWEIYPDQVLVDAIHIRANDVTEFSLWCIGSTGNNTFSEELEESLISDPGLEAAIREALAFGPDDPILETDLEALTELHADTLDIIDLTGIEYCINLEVLSLQANLIEDISPLSDLTGLEELDLGGNLIDDISPISNLTNLGALYLDNNIIEDIRALVNLTKIGDTGGQNRQRGDGEEVLIHLGLSENNIGDLRPLLVNQGISDGDGIDVRGNDLWWFSYFVILGPNGLVRGRGVSVLADPFSEKGEATLAITSIEAAPGTNTAVQLVIVGAAVTAGETTIKYDASMITVGEVEGTDLTSDMLLAVNKDVPGEMKLSVAGMEPTSSGIGVLVNIGLTVSADAQTGIETTLEFGDVEMYDASGATIPLILEDGVVEVTQPGIKGDVNGDGKVRSNDAIMALRIAVSLIEPSDYQAWAADMNGDGKIRSNDAIFILRKAANLAAPGIGIPANASRQITVTLAEAHGVAGESVVVPLNVDNIAGLASGDIHIVYDSAVLRVVDISPNSGVLLATSFAEPGMVRMAFAGVDRLNSETVAEIRFDILADSTSPLKLQRVDLYSPDTFPIDSELMDGEFRSWAMPAERSALLQNFPNPFNPETWIPYQLREKGEVAIRIYSAAGELVRELDLGHKSAGLYVSRDRAAYWDGRNKFGAEVSSGVYFYSIQAGDFSAVRKLIALK